MNRGALPPLARALHRFSGIAVLVTVLTAESGVAAPKRHAAWADQSALTVMPGRVEVGVLSESVLGVSGDLELRLHPLLFFALPHVEGKVRWWQTERWQLASRHRLSYPTLFLSLVAREGVGGLLPATTDVPEALSVAQDLVLSWEVLRGHWLSVEAGAAVAPRTGELAVLLDFPFLYQRFAELSAPIVPRVGASLNGRLWSFLGYSIETRQRWLLLDFDRSATSTDLDAAVHLQSSVQRLSFAAKWTRATLPVGERQYLLPYIDYRLAF